MAGIKFTADRKELLAGITWAARGLPLRTPCPILLGMRLDVTAGKLTAAAFDYDMTARSIVAAVDTADGTALADGPALVKAVKSLPAAKGAAPVTGVVTGETLTLTCNGVTASVPLLPMDEYPDLPAMPPEAGVALSGDFANAARRVSAAAGTDDTLPVLTCVHLELSADALTFAATDRYRLAVDEISWTAAQREWLTTDAPKPKRGGKRKAAAALASAPGTCSVNVPAKPLVAFAKAAGGTDGKVTMHVGELPPDNERGYGGAGAFVAFSDGTHELITRASEGEFPRFRSLLPSSVEASADVDADTLAAAVKRAGKQCAKNSPVRLHFRRDGVTVTGHADGTVTSSETVALADELDTPPAADGYRVCGWLQGFSAEYIASIIGAAGGTARLAWAGRNKPVSITSDAAGAHFRGLVMPIRLAS